MLVRTPVDDAADVVAPVGEVVLERGTRATAYGGARRRRVAARRPRPPAPTRAAMLCYRARSHTTTPRLRTDADAARGTFHVHGGDPLLSCAFLGTEHRDAATGAPVPDGAANPSYATMVVRTRPRGRPIDAPEFPGLVATLSPYEIDVDVRGVRDDGGATAEVQHARGFAAAFLVRRGRPFGYYLRDGATGALERLSDVSHHSRAEFEALYPGMRGQIPATTDDDGLCVCVVHAPHNSTLVRAQEPFAVDPAGDGRIHFPLYSSLANAQADQYGGGVASEYTAISTAGTGYAALFAPDIPEGYHVYTGDVDARDFRGNYVVHFGLSTDTTLYYFDQTHAAARSASGTAAAAVYPYQAPGTLDLADGFWTPTGGVLDPPNHMTAFTADVVEYNFVPLGYLGTMGRLVTIFTGILYVDWRQSLARAVNGYTATLASEVDRMEVSDFVRTGGSGAGGFLGFRRMLPATPGGWTPALRMKYDALLFMVYTLFYDAGFFPRDADHAADPARRALPPALASPDYDYRNEPVEAEHRTQTDGEDRRATQQLQTMLTSIVDLSNVGQVANRLSIDTDKVRADLYPARAGTVAVGGAGGDDLDVDYAQNRFVFRAAAAGGGDDDVLKIGRDGVVVTGGASAAGVHAGARLGPAPVTAPAGGGEHLFDTACDGLYSVAGGADRPFRVVDGLDAHLLRAFFRVGPGYEALTLTSSVRPVANLYDIPMLQTAFPLFDFLAYAGGVRGDGGFEGGGAGDPTVYVDNRDHAHANRPGGSAHTQIADGSELSFPVDVRTADTDASYRLLITLMDNRHTDRVDDDPDDDIELESAQVTMPAGTTNLQAVIADTTPPTISFGGSLPWGGALPDTAETLVANTRYVRAVAAAGGGGADVWAISRAEALATDAARLGPALASARRRRCLRRRGALAQLAADGPHVRVHGRPGARGAGAARPRRRGGEPVRRAGALLRGLHRRGRGELPRGAPGRRAGPRHVPPVAVAPVRGRPGAHRRHRGRDGRGGHERRARAPRHGGGQPQPPPRPDGQPHDGHRRDGDPRRRRRRHRDLRRERHAELHAGAGVRHRRRLRRHVRRHGRGGREQQHDDGRPDGHRRGHDPPGHRAGDGGGDGRGRVRARAARARPVRGGGRGQRRPRPRRGDRRDARRGDAAWPARRARPPCGRPSAPPRSPTAPSPRAPWLASTLATSRRAA